MPPLAETACRRARILRTPTGPFAIIDDGARLETRWVDGPDDPAIAGAERDDALRPGLAARLLDYFAGADVDFGDIPTPRGGPFFERCWAACRAIPRGSTHSYAQLAEAAGSPRAARAAGQAMRRNPLPIIIPCHRIRGSDGDLGGFMGVDTESPLFDTPATPNADAPLDIKRWLLEAEGAV